MVRERSLAAGLAGVLLVLVVSICFVMAARAPAQEESEPIIEETYGIALNDVGDAHVVDTIKYVNSDDYEIIKNLADESPRYLSRRYTDNTSIGEVVDFKVDLGDSSNSVILTFDTPGYAYNMKEYWMVPGFPVEAEKDSGNKYESVTQYIWNNEFTAFTDQMVEITTVVEFPSEASDIRYDDHEKVMKYSMPAAGTKLGFFSENRTVLLIVFGTCTLLFLALFVLVLTGRAAPVPASSRPATAVPPPAVTPGSHTSPTAPPAGPPPPARPAPPQSTPAAPAEPPPAQVAKVYCKNCGAEMGPGKKFCTSCGEQG